MDRQTGEILKHRVQRVQVGSDPVTGIFDMIMMPLKDKQTSRKHLQKKKKGGREREGKKETDGKGGEGGRERSWPQCPEFNELVSFSNAIYHQKGIFLYHFDD